MIIALPVFYFVTLGNLFHISRRTSSSIHLHKYVRNFTRCFALSILLWICHVSDKFSKTSFCLMCSENFNCLFYLKLFDIIILKYSINIFWISKMRTYTHIYLNWLAPLAFIATMFCFSTGQWPNGYNQCDISFHMYSWNGKISPRVLVENHGCH